MKFKETFSRKNTNSIQKASMIVGLTAFLCLVNAEILALRGEGLLILISISASILTFYLFKK